MEFAETFGELSHRVNALVLRLVTHHLLLSSHRKPLPPQPLKHLDINLAVSLIPFDCNQTWPTDLTATPEVQLNGPVDHSAPLPWRNDVVREAKPSTENEVSLLRFPSPSPSPISSSSSVYCAILIERQACLAGFCRLLLASREPRQCQFAKRPKKRQKQKRKSVKCC